MSFIGEENFIRLYNEALATLDKGFYIEAEKQFKTLEDHLRHAQNSQKRTASYYGGTFLACVGLVVMGIPGLLIGGPAGLFGGKKVIEGISRNTSDSWLDMIVTGKQHARDKTPWIREDFGNYEHFLPGDLVK
jgi:hypothetical protein